MKAWMVWGADDDNGCSIVFAESRNKARQNALCTDACEEDRYIDIHAKRIPELDGYENAEPKDNPWLNDEVRLILVKDYDWACIEPWWEDCDECCAKEFCHFFD